MCGPHIKLLKHLETTASLLKPCQTNCKQTNELFWIFKKKNPTLQHIVDYLLEPAIESGNYNNFFYWKENEVGIRKPQKNTHLLHSKFTKICHQEEKHKTDSSSSCILRWSDYVTIKTCNRTMICQTHQPTSTTTWCFFNKWLWYSDFLAAGTEPKIPSSQPSPYGPMIGSVVSEFFLFLGFRRRAFRKTRCLPDWVTGGQSFKHSLFQFPYPFSFYNVIPNKVICKVTLSFIPVPSFCGIRKVRKFY